MVLIAKWELSELESCQAYNPATWPLWSWPDNICPKRENSFSELLCLGLISGKLSHCTGGNEHSLRTVRTAPWTSVSTAGGSWGPALLCLRWKQKGMAGEPGADLAPQSRGPRTPTAGCLLAAGHADWAASLADAEPTTFLWTSVH